MLRGSIEYIFKSSSYTLCTSSVCLKGRLNLNQQSNLARKFLNKPILPNENIIPKERAASVKARKKIGLRDNKPSFREIKLSKIFMEKITDIISTSDISTQVESSGLEITQVQVMPGLKALNVYWSCLRNEDEERVSDVLLKGAPYITYQLVLLGVLGRIPPLVFIRDDSYKNVLEVEKRLRKADFGPEFAPSYTYPEPSSVVRQFNEANTDSTQNENVVDLTSIGPLRQDVLGVHRDKIMESVRKGLSGSRGDHRAPSSEIASYSQVQEIVKAREKNANSKINYSRTAEIRKWASKYKMLRKATLNGNDEITASFISPEEFENDHEDLEETTFLDEDDYYDIEKT